MLDIYKNLSDAGWNQPLQLDFWPYLKLKEIMYASYGKPKTYYTEAGKAYCGVCGYRTYFGDFCKECGTMIYEGY